MNTLASIIGMILKPIMEVLVPQLLDYFQRPKEVTIVGASQEDIDRLHDHIDGELRKARSTARLARGVDEVVES